MIDNPIFENENIKLRLVLPSDTESIFAAVIESIAELSPWMPWCTKEYSIEETKKWCASREEEWKEGAAYDFVIMDKNSESLLGICGLNNINHEVKFANLGYWVRTGRTGHGTATAVVPMLAKFGFDTLNLNRIEIVVAEGNLSSQRVAEKAGALREGFLRKRLFVNGRSLDAFMFSFIRTDFD